MQFNTVTSALLAILVAPIGFPQQGDHEANTTGVPIPPLPTFTTADPAVYGREIATYADLYEQGYRDEILQGDMTLFDADDDSVRRGFTRMVLEDSSEGDKLVIKFLTPAEIKGVAALTHENSGSSDDNWLYLPANKRVRRMSGANNTASFQGTEFTYEDLSNLDPGEYEWRMIEETEIRSRRNDNPGVQARRQADLQGHRLLTHRRLLPPHRVADGTNRVLRQGRAAPEDA